MDEINRNRLEEFRQLKKEVWYSEEYLIVLLFPALHLLTFSNFFNNSLQFL
jgi:hypothetical protein